MWLQLICAFSLVAISVAKPYKDMNQQEFHPDGVLFLGQILSSAIRPVASAVNNVHQTVGSRIADGKESFVASSVSLQQSFYVPKYKPLLQNQESSRVDSSQNINLAGNPEAANNNQDQNTFSSSYDKNAVSNDNSQDTQGYFGSSAVEDQGQQQEQVQAQYNSGGQGKNAYQQQGQVQAQHIGSGQGNQRGQPQGQLQTQFNNGGQENNAYQESSQTDRPGIQYSHNSNSGQPSRDQNSNDNKKLSYPARRNSTSQYGLQSTTSATMISFPTVTGRSTYQSTRTTAYNNPTTTAYSRPTTKHWDKKKNPQADSTSDVIQDNSSQMNPSDNLNKPTLVHTVDKHPILTPDQKVPIVIEYPTDNYNIDDELTTRAPLKRPNRTKHPKKPNDSSSSYEK